jgi:transcriptional regulator with XRE-family HTH domain
MNIGEVRVPISTLFNEQYREADNKEELDYWAPLAQLISECIEARSLGDLSQKRLAEKMKTKQSVISRFENLDGRLPSYDFLARLSLALGHSPGMTLFGEYMATVPLTQHELVSRLASERGLTSKELVGKLLECAILELENKWPMRLQEQWPTEQAQGLFTDLGSAQSQPFAARTKDAPLGGQSAAYGGTQDETKQPSLTLAA